VIADADTVSGQHRPVDLAADVSRLEAENANLRRKLETQPAIEQAKGILMERYGVSADGAFELLRHWSQDSNTKLNHLAVVLTTGPKDGPAGGCPEPRPS
jgi:AmiR/NasT family two-component response regulator